MGGIRAPHLREGANRRCARCGFEARVTRRNDRDRHRDRSVSAGGAAVPADARGTAASLPLRGLVVRDYHEEPLIVRDRDLLARIQERNELQIHVSLITADPKLARRLEARSPIPAARLRALHQLVAAGINAGLIVAPVLPGITDSVAHLDTLFAAARKAGALFIHAGALRLYAAGRDRFIPLLGQHYPDLVERYERAYAKQAGAPREYARALARRVQRLQKKHGFT